MKRITSICLLIVGLCTFSCSSGDGGSGGSDSYDRKQLLTSWADNIIIPAFVNYQAKLDVLSAKVSAFNDNPSQNALVELRSAWLEGYKAYQKVGMFSIGKAEEIYFKESSNTYPSDVNGINANIAVGNFDITSISQISKQGFPAFDYMINGLGNSDSAILDFYTANPSAASYKSYLSALALRLSSQANIILGDWNGGYRASFINNSGNSASSSVNKMTNNLVKYFEKDIRAAKVGIPAGVFSNGVKYPEKVEAYYKNDVSKELLASSLQAAQDFFNGKHFGMNMTGEGLKSYLDSVNAVRNGQNLSEIINSQFNSANSAIAALDNSFSQQVFTDNSKMLSVYDAMQQNVVYLKLDMMQALNITLDYVDSDGD